MPSMDKEFELKAIMTEVFALAAIAWPDEIPADALRKIMDIQETACLALDLPEDLDLTDGSIFT